MNIGFIILGRTSSTENRVICIQSSCIICYHLFGTNKRQVVATVILGQLAVPFVDGLLAQYHFIRLLALSMSPRIVLSKRLHCFRYSSRLGVICYLPFKIFAAFIAKYASIATGPVTNAMPITTVPLSTNALSVIR